MADDDNSINFSKLQNEFYSAKQADEKYTRENDAKFRAVHQKVGSYEEFRDIVTASHLKPLDRGDVTGATQANQPWNPLFADNNEAATNNSTVTATPVENDIKSRNGFLKSLNASKSKIDFLVQFDRSFLTSIFRCDIPFNLLETTIDEFTKDFPTDDGSIGKMVDVLLAFTSCERFQLTLKFLVKSDKVKLIELFERINKHGGDSKELEKLYGV